jgi:hypothetical protein
MRSPRGKTEEGGEEGDGRLRVTEPEPSLSMYLRMSSMSLVSRVDEKKLSFALSS